MGEGVHERLLRIFETGVLLSREPGESSASVAVGCVACAELVGVTDPFEARRLDVVEGAEEEVAGDAVNTLAV